MAKSHFYLFYSTLTCAYIIYTCRASFSSLAADGNGFVPGAGRDLSGLDISMLTLVQMKLGIIRQSPTTMFHRQSITATLGRRTIALIIRGTA